MTERQELISQIKEEKGKFTLSYDEGRTHEQMPALDFDNVLEIIEQLENGSFENKLSIGE